MNWYLAVLKKYAVFGGRARRKEYWMFFLFNMIIAFCLGLIEGIVGGTANVLANVYQLVILMPSIAVGIRRMHDVGKSGWFILIPIYNFILTLKAGDTGDNQFGPNPIQEKVG